MKHIKQFEDLAYGLHPLSYDTDKELKSVEDEVEERKRKEKEEKTRKEEEERFKSIISPEKFKKILYELEKDLTIRDVKSEMRKLKIDFPFIQQVEPYKTMYSDFVKKYLEYSSYNRVANKYNL